MRSKYINGYTAPELRRRVKPMGQDKLVKISQYELRSLMADSIKLSILEGDGVDNWSYYMEGSDEYTKMFMNDNPDFEAWFKDSVGEDDIDDYYIDYDTIASFIVETKY